MKKLLLAVIPGLVALSLGVYFGYQKLETNIPDQQQASLSDIALPDVTGTTQTGEQWLGKVVLVNHWATWCPPCIEELPLLIEIQKSYADQGFQVVGIAHDKAEPTQVFGDQIGINYPSLVIDRAGRELMISQGNPQGAALPFTAIFDRDGAIVHTHLGLLKADALTKILNDIL